jgi:hypothetical protein
MEVMFDVGPGVKRDAGAVHSMSMQARERRAREREGKAPRCGWSAWVASNRGMVR